MSALVPARPRRAACLALLLLGVGLGPLSGTAAAEESCTVLAGGTDAAHVCAVPVGAPSSPATFLVLEGVDRIALTLTPPSETSEFGEDAWLSVTAGSSVSFRLDGVDLLVDVSTALAPGVDPATAGVTTTTSAVSLDPVPTGVIDVVYVSSAVLPVTAVAVAVAQPLDVVTPQPGPGSGAPVVEAPEVEAPEVEVPEVEVPEVEVPEVEVPEVEVPEVEVPLVGVEPAAVPAATTEGLVPAPVVEAPVGDPVADEPVAVEPVVADPVATVPTPATETSDVQAVVVTPGEAGPGSSPDARVADVAPIIPSSPDLAIAALQGPASAQVLRDGDRELLGGVGLGIVGLALAVGGLAVAASGQRRGSVETRSRAWIEDRD